jgi:two-component system chemotaxis response regulator CheB
MHVLIVDDSAVVRQAVREILTRERDITADTANDPVMAMTKIARQRPDVIVLDLEMPRMDGLTFLRRLNASDPIPVVICSALAGRGTETALRALEEGAIEIVTKPKLGVKDFLIESSVAIVDAVRSAARARRGRPAARPHPDTSLRDAAPLRLTTEKIIAIGASTGGTEAIAFFLQSMPADAPAVVIVQHMPEVFTAAYAQRLNQMCVVEVKEAADGDRATPGRALIAPGNRHMQLHRSGAVYTVRVAEGPLVSRHRPSVDVLFHSVARAAGMNAVGVIMTGMGDDGAAGLLAMREAGAFTLAQDEESCVVFGMPGAAIHLGAAEQIAPLSSLPRLALQKIARMAG